MLVSSLIHRVLAFAHKAGRLFRVGPDLRSISGFEAKRSAVVRTIIRCSFVCLTLAVILISLTLATLRSDAIRDASTNADNIAIVLAEQTSRSLQAVDLVLTDIQDHIRRLEISTPDEFRAALKTQEAYGFLRQRLLRLPKLDVITLADSRGDVVNLSREWPTPKVNIADREYFRYFVQIYDTRTFIAAPVTSRVSGQPVIFFSRRISADDGTFLGLVLVGLEPTYFRDIYESIGALHYQRFELVRSDGSIIVQYPREDVPGAKIDSSSPWYDATSEGGGQYRFQDASGNFHIGESRGAGRYPVFVNVTVAESAALANWNKGTVLIVIGTLLIVGCPIVLLLLLQKMFKSLVKSEDSLANYSQQLEQVNTRLDIAFNNMSQGLCFFDGNQRLIISNKRFVEMYDLSVEQVGPGKSLSEIVDLRFQAGTSPKMSREEYLEWRKAISVSDKPSDTIVELNNGNFVRIHHRPMPDGGWVATHEDVTASKRAEARISYMARHDALTGLANRSYFNETMEAATEHIDEQCPFAVLMFDLDGFKAVNDSMGHAAGDALLKEVAARLRQVAGERGFVARLGGDEFAIIATVVTEGVMSRRDGVIGLARRAIEVIKEPILIEGNGVSVGTSVGIALAPDDGVEADDILKKADLALYKSKEKGRNVCSVFDPQMMIETLELHKLEADMRRGISQSEFEIHYQPIINARSNEIVGAEALLRWHHPQLGLISPASFIPLAESTGLIVPLGEFVLRQACLDAATWPADFKVAVNVSATQFRQPGLFDVIMRALDESGLPAARLEVEITESVLLENETSYSVLLHQLKKIGVSVALDDFGVGYSSLSYLKQFPFDKIKIDRSFITDVAEDEGSMAIVSAIIGLSRSLDMSTTAEGIETERQLEIMRAAGVTFAQGYLIGRPCPVAAFNERIKPSDYQLASLG